MIAFFYSENNCSFQSTVDYLLTIVPQSSTGTTTSSKSNQISDELIAKAIQQILSRSEEPSADNIEKEIEKLRGGTLKKEDISKDEMVAQAIQTLLNRNEEITESNIEKEIQQIQADILLAHQIQV